MPFLLILTLIALAVEARLIVWAKGEAWQAAHPAFTHAVCRCSRWAAVLAGAVPLLTLLRLVGLS